MEDPLSFSPPFASFYRWAAHNSQSKKWPLREERNCRAWTVEGGTREQCLSLEEAGELFGHAVGLPGLELIGLASILPSA